MLYNCGFFHHVFFFSPYLVYPTEIITMNDISSLVTAAELSAKLKNLVSEARILELAESKMIPHYNIDEHIMFPIARAKQWILNNFVVYHAGEEIGGQGIVTTINVVSPSPENTVVPVEIRGVSSFLIPLALESVESVSTTGVYFLCSRGKVVYVGQSSKCVMGRVGQHFGKKTFDFAFFLRIPVSDLAFVEREFIMALQPKYNWDKKGKRLIAPPEYAGSYTQTGERIIRAFMAAHNEKEAVSE